MQPARPNENGVLEAGCREVVARHGRADAAITIALCEDGLWRYGVDMRYAHGGFSIPIFIHAQGCSTPTAARMAALERILKAWHSPLPSDPETVRDQLAEMRQQIEARMRQPSLF